MKIKTKKKLLKALFVGGLIVGGGTLTVLFLPPFIPFFSSLPLPAIVGIVVGSLAVGCGLFAGGAKGWKYKEKLDNLTLIGEASKGNLANVKDMLEDGEDVSKCNEEGHTALILAAINGHVDVVRLLLQYNANRKISASSVIEDVATGKAKQFFNYEKKFQLVRAIDAKHIIDPEKNPLHLFLQSQLSDAAHLITLVVQFADCSDSEEPLQFKEDNNDIKANNDVVIDIQLPSKQLNSILKNSNELKQDFVRVEEKRLSLLP